MSKLISIFSLISLVGSPLLISNKIFLDKNVLTNSVKKIENKTNITNLHLSKYSVNLNQDYSKNQDVVYDDALKKSILQEQDQSNKIFLTNLNNYKDKWFMISKINFKINMTINTTNKAIAIVKALPDCPIYFGTKIIKFNLNNNFLTKDLTKLQKIIDNNFHGYFENNYSYGWNLSSILMNLDNKLLIKESTIFGSSYIFSQLYLDKKIKITRSENYDIHNPNNDLSQKNDYFGDYQIKIFATDDWTGSIFIKHQIILYQSLENFNNWKKSLLSFNLNNPLKINQGSRDCNQYTDQLVFDAFIKIEINSYNLIGLHMFGDKKGQSLNTDFLTKYKWIFLLKLTLLNLQTNFNYYQATISFNLTKDIPFNNFAINSTFNFVIQLL